MLIKALRALFLLVLIVVARQWGHSGAVLWVRTWYAQWSMHRWGARKKDNTIGFRRACEVPHRASRVCVANPFARVMFGKSICTGTAYSQPTVPTISLWALLRAWQLSCLQLTLRVDGCIALRESLCLLCPAPLPLPGQSRVTHAPSAEGEAATAAAATSAPAAAVATRTRAAAAAAAARTMAPPARTRAAVAAASAAAAAARSGAGSAGLGGSRGGGRGGSSGARDGGGGAAEMDGAQQRASKRRRA